MASGAGRDRATTQVAGAGHVEPHPHGICQLSHKGFAPSLQAVGAGREAEVVGSDPFRQPGGIGTNELDRQSSHGARRISKPAIQRERHAGSNIPCARLSAFICTHLQAHCHGAVTDSPMSKPVERNGTADGRETALEVALDNAAPLIRHEHESSAGDAAGGRREDDRARRGKLCETVSTERFQPHASRGRGGGRGTGKSGVQPQAAGGRSRAGRSGTTA